MIKKIKRNDTKPYATVQIVDSDNNVLDLTGFTINFTMVRKADKVVIIDSQSVTLSDPLNGICEYRWQTGDTDVEDTYLGEFEITDLTGKKYTLPVDDTYEIQIYEDFNKT